MPAKLIYKDALNSCYTNNQIKDGRKQIIELKNGLVKIGHFCENNVCEFTTDIISEACCLRTGQQNGKDYTFDVDTQKCYWKSGYTTNDCVKKLSFNSNKNDSSLFEIGLGETCGLNVSFDYLINFDCSVFNATCERDTDEKLSLESQLKDLQTQYSSLLSLAKLNNVFILRSFNDFENLCYVIEGTLGNNSMPRLVASSQPSQPSQSSLSSQNSPIAPFGLPTTGSEPDTPVGDVIASPDFIIPSSNDIDLIYNTDFVSNKNLFLGWPWFKKKGKIIKNLSKPISMNLTDISPTYNDIISNLQSVNPVINDGVSDENLFSSWSFGRRKGKILKNLSKPVTMNLTDITSIYDDVYSEYIDYNGLDFKYFSPKNIPPLFGGGLGEIKYCLTDLGLELFKNVIGEEKYNSFYNSYGCEKSYTPDDFNNFINEITNLVKTQSKIVSDYIVQTTQNTCDKFNKYNEYAYFESKKAEYTVTLTTLSSEITNLTSQLNSLTNYGDSSLESLQNIENLKLTFVLEYKDKDEYKTIYENEFFNIGENNMSQYIIEKDGDTGILISGATTELCSVYKEQFIKTLYTERYITDNTAPETEAEKNEVNKLLNGWYNSKFINYNIDIPEDIVKQIDGKQIRHSILIDTCCLDLCLLTDNIKLDKKCASLDNQNIIVSKPPHFELERVLDNKKSWVNIDEPTNREFDLLFRETNYVANDPKLILNTKEIELKIDGANAIEEDVLNNISCLISGTSETYVGCENIDLDEKLTTDLSLINNVDEFRKALTSELIDVKTRKILSKYPVLYLLYDRYMGNCSDCSTNRLTYDRVKSFIDSIGKYWVNLAEQFVPSTSIWGATDVVRNPIFSTQKHKYRKGIIGFGKNSDIKNNKSKSNDSIKTIDTTTECVIFKVDFKPMPTSLAASATTLNYQFDVDFETSLVSNPSNPIEYNIIVDDVQQTYGNIDIKTLENKLNIINENIMNNPFSSGSTTEFGICSSVGFYNPMFIGKVTIKDNNNPILDA